MQRTATAPLKPLQLNSTPKKGVGIAMNDVFIRCVVFVCYVCQMLVLYNRSNFENITGPIFAVCVVILICTDYYYIPLAIVVLTPNAIGTVLMGRLSFYMFMGIAMLVRLFAIKLDVAFKITDICWLALGMFNLLHLNIYMLDHVGTEKLTMMAILSLWMIFLRVDRRRDPEIVDKFLLAFAFAIVTNAFISLITRSATKYEASDRLGIIGIGANDPNIAAMMLTIAIAIIVSSRYLKGWLKTCLIIIPVLSIITTVSISGLLAIIILLLTFGIIMNKDRHNLSVFMFIILGALVAVYIFPSLGIMGEKNVMGETTNYLEYYQEKINDRFSSLLTNDIDAATSGRASITKKNLAFLSEQSIIKQLFGGNKVNPLGKGVSHNTYADMVLRFGYIGFFNFIIIVLYSLAKSVSRLKESKNCTVLLCKIMLLYWAVTLSVFDGSVAVLWLSVVLMF